MQSSWVTSANYLYIAVTMLFLQLSLTSLHQIFQKDCWVEKSYLKKLKLNIKAQWVCSSSFKCVLFFPAGLKRVSYISKWIGMCWTLGSEKKRSLFECVPMCLCVYARVCSYVCVCVCKYVLMGPLIKTPGVSAICQHWSIGQETDSSPCACECVRVLVCVCARTHAHKNERVFPLSSGSLLGDRFTCHSKVSFW